MLLRRGQRIARRVEHARRRRGRRGALEVRADQEQQQRQRDPAEDQRRARPAGCVCASPTAASPGARARPAGARPSRARPAPAAAGRSTAAQAASSCSRAGQQPAPRAVARVLRRLSSRCSGIGGPYICAMTPAEAAVGRLVVCPTPIGNLEDVTLRVLAALGEADVDRLRGHAPHRRCCSTATASRARARQPPRAQRTRARRGAASSACAPARSSRSSPTPGTPLVSDPGFALVRARPGARSSRSRCCRARARCITALVASGLPVDRWSFVGFLPRARRELESAARRARRRRSSRSSRPGASRRRLGVLAERDPERPVAVCRELTKLHEEVRRGSAAELAATTESAPARGEVVLVCGAARAWPRAPREEALAALRELVDAGARPRPAAAALAKLTGLAPTSSTGEAERRRMRARPGAPRGAAVACSARCPST